jgi:hypothetical protein
VLRSNPLASPEPATLGSPPSLFNPQTATPLIAVPDMGSAALAAGQHFSFAIPPGTFTHSDGGGQITLTARLADGQPLPAWLRFDPVTGTLAGDVPAGLSRDVTIEVVARDANGHQVVSTVKLAAPPAAKPRQSSEAEPARDAQPLAAALAALGLPAERTPQPLGRPSLAAQFDQFGRPARQHEAARLLHHLQQQVQHQEAQPVEPA